MIQVKVALLVIWDFNKSPISDEIELGILAQMLRDAKMEVKLFGKLPQKIDMQEILDFGPDLFACHVYKHSVVEIGQAVESLKEQAPKIQTCLISSETQSAIPLMAEIPGLDFAIDGEVEEACLQLALHLEERDAWSQIPRLIYRDGEQLIQNGGCKLVPNLDTLPFAARDFLVQLEKQCAQVRTSRGCYGRCSFCPSRVIADQYRCRSVEHVLDEIEMLKREYGVEVVHFTDKSLEDPEDGPERLEELLQGILERELNIFYFANMRTTIHRRDPKIWDLFEKSGLFSVCLGIESGNEFDLEIYHKNATLEDHNRAIELFTGIDVSILPGFIFYNPYSTLKNLGKNVDFLEEHGFAANFAYLTNRYNLVPDTPFFEKIQQDGLIRGSEEQFFSYQYLHPVIEKLGTYINQVMWDVNRQNNGFRLLEFFAKYYPLNVKLLKKMFARKELEPAYLAMVEMEQEIAGLLRELNQVNVAYYRELLDLAESGWDEQIADQITDQYMSVDQVQRRVVRFMKNQRQLYKRLYALNLKSYTAMLAAFR